jgi:hypothetical protein
VSPTLTVAIGIIVFGLPSPTNRLDGKCKFETRFPAPDKPIYDLVLKGNVGSIRMLCGGYKLFVATARSLLFKLVKVDYLNCYYIT